MSIFSGFFDWLRGLFSPTDRYRVTLPGSGCRLYVGNLSYSAKEDDLKKLFSKYGRVLEVNIIRDRVTRRLKGYAFVEMPEDDAKKALALGGVEFLGRKIVVSEARSKGNHPNGREEGGEQNGGGNQRQGGGKRSRRVGRSSSRRGAGPTTFKGGKDKPMLERYE